jgi:hypothetical protein
VTAVLDPITHGLSISWNDRFSDETAYGIECYNSDANSNTWNRIETLAKVNGVGNKISWKTIIDVAVKYRVVAVKGEYSVPLCTTAGNSELPVPLPSSPPLLTLGSPEPLKGQVGVSISGGTGILSVDYYADLARIGTSGTGPDFPVTWNTAELPDGVHLLSAMAKTGPGVYLELRLEVTLDNPNLAIQMTLSGTSGLVYLDVKATADVGIQSVESFIDGNSLGALSTPNNGTQFRWQIDTLNVSAGQHTLRAIATDRSGNTAESTITPTFDQPPVLTIDSPTNGAIVSSQLIVSGSFSDDTPGTSVSITFRDVPLLQTSASPFTITYDLTGVMPGHYTLTVQATDANQHTTIVQLSVIVETGTEFQYNFVANGETILAADGGQLLYQTSDGAVHLRSADSTEIILSDTGSIQDADDWRLSNGRVTVFGELGGYPNPCQVFLYEPGGNRRNLSVETKSIGFYDLHQVMQWPWVVWSSQWENSTGGYGGTHALDTYILFNMQTGGYYSIAMPTSASRLANWYYALALLPSDTRFYYWAVTGGSGTSSLYDIFFFSTLSQTSTRVTDGGYRQIYVQSDGNRVAWRKTSVGIDEPFSIMVGTATNPQMSTSITSLGRSFILRDGVLAWLESDGVTYTLRADDGSQITLSLLNSAQLLSVGGGHVIYSEAGKLYIWDRSKGVRRLLNSLPWGVLVDGNSIYVMIQGAIYLVDVS